MVNEATLTINEIIEFSVDQISCITELQAEMDKTLHRWVFVNLRYQAHLHAPGVHIKGDGHQLIVQLNFL
jgi:hypothetical protein